MTDTVLTIGDFAFSRFEVPEQIRGLGGEQALTVHRLIGGRRVVDAMGADPTPLDWSGLFVGQSALDRALALDALRKAGKPLVLTWSQYRYTVVIRRFECDFVRFYRLPYQISCEPVSDDTTPLDTPAAPDATDLVASDVGSAASLSLATGDDQLIGLLGIAQAAVPASIATASPAQLTALQVALAAARARTGLLISGSDATLDGATTIGGVVTGATAAAQLAALSAQTGAAASLPTLIMIDRTLARVAANVSATGSATATVTTAGGDLYAIAAAHYGDAMGWTAIAQANGLVDPEIAGLAKLQLPAFTNDTGGVLGG